MYDSVGDYTMKTKKCITCKLDLPLNSFNANKTKKDGYQNKCRDCSKQYLKSHYRENKKYYRNKAKKATEKHRAWWKEYKSQLVCEKCGEDHPACIQFHHKNPKNKSFDVSRGVSNFKSKELIIKEIKKCIPLCANCHAKLHWDE